MLARRHLRLILAFAVIAIKAPLGFASENPCESVLRIAQYALDAKLATPAVQAENTLLELDYGTYSEDSSETGVIGYIKPLVTIIKSEPQIEYRRPLDMPYQVSNRGDEVFVLRTYALNTPQHEIESQKNLWYKIKYVDSPTHVQAEIYLLQDGAETKVGHYELSKTWIETQRRLGTQEFKIGSPGVRYELNEEAYESLKLPAGFVSQLRFDLYQIVAEALVHPLKKVD